MAVMKTTSKTAGQVKRAPRSRAQWLVDVIEWRKSGQTAAAFGGPRGLSPKMLTLWSSKLRHELPPRVATGAKHKSAFVPVRVTDGRGQNRAGRGNSWTGTAATTSEFAITLSNGRRVQVSSAIEPEVLARLLDALDGAARC